MNDAKERSITAREFSLLQNVVETPREGLILQLIARVGLSTPEVTELTTEMIRSSYLNDRVTVIDINDRIAIVPPELVEELEAYISEEAIGPQEPVINLTARRVQMIVRDIGSRAAERYAEPAVASVTGQDLRAYFIRYTHQQENLPARVIQACGGWQSFEPIDNALPPVDEETIVRSFRSTNSTAINRILRTVLESACSADTGQECIEKVLTGLTNETAYWASWYREHLPCAEFDAVAAAVGIEPSEIKCLTKNESIDCIPTLKEPVAVTDLKNGDTLLMISVENDDVQLGTLFAISDGECRLTNSEYTCFRLVGQHIGQTIVSLRERALADSNRAIELTIEQPLETSVIGSIAALVGEAPTVEELTVTDKGAAICYLSFPPHVTSNHGNMSKTLSAIQCARPINRDSDRVFFEVVIGGSSIITDTIAMGGHMERIRLKQSVITYTIYVPQTADIRGFVSSLQKEGRELSVVKKQLVDINTQPQPDEAQPLSPRQNQVITAALQSGYFDWPRGRTAQEIAETLEISPPTFHRHLREGLSVLLQSTLSHDSQMGKKVPEKTAVTAAASSSTIDG